jgi:hypothetical protein
MGKVSCRNADAEPFDAKKLAEGKVSPQEALVFAVHQLVEGGDIQRQKLCTAQRHLDRGSDPRDGAKAKYDYEKECHW